MDNLLRAAFKNKTVLVTGSTGFKGSWLSLWLVELGCNVVGYSLSPPTEPSLFNSLSLQDKVVQVTGDVRDQEHVASVMSEYTPDFVFHLAAQPLVRFSYLEPRLTFETNVMGSINVLEAVRRTDSVRVCVNITSDKCYDNKEWVYGYREIDPMGGSDPYSCSKGCAELVTASYRKSFFNDVCEGGRRLALSSVRAGNVIGGGDWASDRIVPDCVKALSSGKKIILRNPQATRPWQYVLEPLAGYLVLAALMEKYGERFSGPWNFGPNDCNVITVEKLVKLAINNWGSGEYAVEGSSFCPPEANLLKLDIGKAQMRLGWKPIYDIQTTVERTIGWYKRFYAGVSGEELYDLSLLEITQYTEKMADLSVYEK
jgi:CDP-glucose 4,6-dehydratase